jgi:hypothetical protein
VPTIVDKIINDVRTNGKYQGNLMFDIKTETLTDLSISNVSVKDITTETNGNVYKVQFSRTTISKTDMNYFRYYLSTGSFKVLFVIPMMQTTTRTVAIQTSPSLVFRNRETGKHYVETPSCTFAPGTPTAAIIAGYQSQEGLSPFNLSLSAGNSDLRYADLTPIWNDPLRVTATFHSDMSLTEGRANKYVRPDIKGAEPFMFVEITNNTSDVLYDNHVIQTDMIQSTYPSQTMFDESEDINNSINVGNPLPRLVQDANWPITKLIVPPLDLHGLPTCNAIITFNVLSDVQIKAMQPATFLLTAASTESQLPFMTVISKEQTLGLEWVKRISPGLNSAINEGNHFLYLYPTEYNVWHESVSQFSFTANGYLPINGSPIGTAIPANLELFTGENGSDVLLQEPYWNPDPTTLTPYSVISILEASEQTPSVIIIRIDLDDRERKWLFIPKFLPLDSFPLPSQLKLPLNAQNSRAAYEDNASFVAMTMASRALAITEWGKSTSIFKKAVINAIYPLATVGAWNTMAYAPIKGIQENDVLSYPWTMYPANFQTTWSSE